MTQMRLDDYVANNFREDEYLKVSRSLLKSQDVTDEEIASSTGLGINMVRRVLFDLFGKGLITGIRVKHETKDWFVYRWSPCNGERFDKI